MKKVAVVILNWNGRALMERYLPQVVQNTNADLAEIVVADNASSDDSLQFLSQRFPDVRTIVLDRNYGFAGGYNRALQQIENEYVVLLNSDVAPASDWLDPLLAMMEGDERIAACAPKIRDDKDRAKFEYAGAAGGYLDAFGYPFCRGRVFDEVEEDRGQYDDNAECLWVSGAALMIRRELYLAVGGLDEDFFAHMEEIDLCWRLVNRGLKVCACGSSVVFHLGGATLDASNPQKTYLNFRNNLIMLVKNYNTGLWPVVVFCRMVLDGVAGLKFLLSGKARFCWAIVRAHFSFWRNLASILHKRKSLKPFRMNHLPSVVRPYSVVFRSFVAGQRKFSELEAK